MESLSQSSGGGTGSFGVLESVLGGERLMVGAAGGFSTLPPSLHAVAASMPSMMARAGAQRLLTMNSFHD